MEVQKRGDTKIIPNHTLDMIGNPTEACLPSSRPSLSSYNLEYDGALRMIRVSIFSNDLMPSGGQGLIYIGRSVQREPLDQTNLRNGVDATQEAVENLHCNVEANRWAQGPGRLQVGPTGPPGSLYLSASAWCPLEPSSVHFAVDKHN